MSNRTQPQVPAAGRKPRLPVRYTPNVTPLIDVMFLLLLFFLLTTTFRTQEGVLPTTLPRTGGGTGPVDVPGLSIYVNPVGRDKLAATYRIGETGQELPDVEKVYDVLASPKYDQDSFRGSTPIIVRTRGDVRWQFVLEAYNQALRAKFSKVTIHQES